MKWQKTTIKQLAQKAGKDVDEVLVILWDNGLKEFNKPTDHIAGYKLKKARYYLNLPTRAEVISPSYWMEILHLDQEKFEDLCKQLGIFLNSRSQRLPKGAIRKLAAEVKKRAHSSFAREERIRVLAETHEVTKTDRTYDFKLKQYGKECLPVFIAHHKILEIHYALVNDFQELDDPIFPAGPRDIALLESAAYRPKTSLGDQCKYLTVEMGAAALFHSLVHNHPFHNGNKRTALVSLLVMLDQNGLMLKCSEDELFQFVLQVAKHRIVKECSSNRNIPDEEVCSIAEWIYNNSRTVEVGEKIVPLRKLKAILTNYDCNFEYGSRGKKIKITRVLKRQSRFFKKAPEKLTSNIRCSGEEGRDVPIGTINKVRSDLKLDEKNGIDSASFYNQALTTNADFIIKYRKILTRLSGL